ncbi:MAG: zinc ribbon domain-containing protein [Motiliproteus sp.]
MPIYEYQCNDCGHQMEALQKISDDALKDCPACEKPALTKLVSAPSFRLSGTGWYETDFKTGNKKNLAGDQPKAKAADSKTADSKTANSKTADSKTAASASKTASTASASS